MKSKFLVFAISGMVLLNTFSFAEYNDVGREAWYYNFVQYVTQNGIMNGVGENKFAPGEDLSRAMISQIIFNMDGKNEVESRELIDVDKSEWYYNAVNWASQNNILKTGENGECRPNEKATREEVVCMMYEFVKYKKLDVSVGENTNILSYNDTFDISEGNYEAFCWACGLGILTGDDNAYLNPKAKITRAETATVIEKFDELLKSKKVPEDDKEAYVVELDGNVTTGYTWEAMNYDKEIISVSDYEYTTNDHEEGMVGVSGVFRFKIKGLKEGETSLTFLYMRTFEGVGSSVRRREYNMKVDDKGIIDVYSITEE